MHDNRRNNENRYVFQIQTMNNNTIAATIMMIYIKQNGTTTQMEKKIERK